MVELCKYTKVGVNCFKKCFAKIVVLNLELASSKWNATSHSYMYIICGYKSMCTPVYCHQHCSQLVNELNFNSFYCQIKLYYNSCV